MARLFALAVLALTLVPALLARPSAGASAREIRIAWTGDIAMAPSSDGGAGFFSSSVRRRLTGDLVIGNLEGTLATGGYSKCGSSSTDCYAFRAPPSYARVLRRAGFNLMNLANNHFYDYGPEAARETVAALRDANIRWTGRPGEIRVLYAGGTSVAFVGFAPYPWAQSLTNIDGAARMVRRAAARADIVVVLMHQGAEGRDYQHVRAGNEHFLGENRGDPIAFTHRVVDAGADLVLGSGPHVLRGMEWYHGRLIAFSLGNFLGNGTLSISGMVGVSGILHVSLRRDGSWARGDLTPIRLVSPGVPAIDPVEEAHGVVRELSKQDFGRNAMRVTRTGVLLPPAWREG